MGLFDYSIILLPFPLVLKGIKTVELAGNGMGIPIVTPTGFDRPIGP